MPIIDKSCPFCGTVNTGRDFPSKRFKGFCGGSCKMNHQRSKPGYVHPLKNPKTLAKSVASRKASFASGKFKVTHSKEKRESISKTMKIKYANGEITNPMDNPETRIKSGQTLKRKYASGEIINGFAGKNHTQEYKDNSSKIMREKFASGELKPSQSKRIKYKGEWFDSKWEFWLAQNLNKQGINWVRGISLQWWDRNNIQRSYFPDFYLPDYDIYLEPKNPFRLKTKESEQDKYQYMKINFPNVRYLLSEYLCKNIVIN